MADNSIELQTLNNNDNKTTCSMEEEVTSGNGGQQYNTRRGSKSSQEMLSLISTQGLNRGNAAEEDVNWSNEKKETTLKRIKKELRMPVYRKVTLWMVIVAIFFLILIVIGVSLLLCSVIHEDVDDKYDPESFKASRCFNGSFSFESLSPSSNQSLSSDLQMKLADIYRSSPALGRYFFQAQIYAFRNGSTEAQYRLRFRIPGDDAELERYTLSRELVYNVFRQNLYDQETEPLQPLHLHPASLGMSDRQECFD